MELRQVHRYLYKRCMDDTRTRQTLSGHGAAASSGHLYKWCTDHARLRPRRANLTRRLIFMQWFQQKYLGLPSEREQWHNEILCWTLHDVKKCSKQRTGATWCCLQHQISLAAAFCTLSSLSLFERPTWWTPLWSFLIFKQWTIRTQIFDDLPLKHVPFFSLLQLGSDVFHSICWCSDRAIKTCISSSVVGTELRSCVKVEVDVLGSRP